MALNIKETKKEGFKILSAGTHTARLTQIIDLGTQDHEYMGEAKTRQRVFFTFEFPNELLPDGRPMVQGNEYTLSLADKAILKPIVEGILGKKLSDAEKANFDIEEFKKLLGTPCMVSIVHNEKDGNTYANIATVSPLMKGLVAPEQINPSVMYEVSQKEDETFAKLPEFLQKKIRASYEFKQSTETVDGIAKEIEQAF